MKRIFLITIILSAFSCDTGQPEDAAVKTDTVSVKYKFQGNVDDSLSFVQHFKILDSVATLYRDSDTIIECCGDLVEFMETKTNLESSSDWDYFGPIGFSKSDLENWHKWYDTTYLKMTTSDLRSEM
jgi:hypothetical protein